jgi:hypothetical protein
MRRRPPLAPGCTTASPGVIGRPALRCSSLTSCREALGTAWAASPTRFRRSRHGMRRRLHRVSGLPRGHSAASASRFGAPASSLRHLVALRGQRRNGIRRPEVGFRGRLRSLRRQTHVFPEARREGWRAGRMSFPKRRHAMRTSPHVVPGLPTRDAEVAECRAGGPGEGQFAVATCSWCHIFAAIPCIDRLPNGARRHVDGGCSRSESAIDARISKDSGNRSPYFPPIRNLFSNRQSKERP